MHPSDKSKPRRRLLASFNTDTNRYRICSAGSDGSVGAPASWRTITFASYNTCLHAIAAIESGMLTPEEWLQLNPNFKRMARLT